MTRNLLAVLFVVLTQAACAAYYSMEPPASFGSRFPPDISR